MDAVYALRAYDPLAQRVRRGADAAPVLPMAADDAYGETTYAEREGAARLREEA